MSYKIKELRVQKGMSQEELAKKCDVSRTIISRLESGLEVNATIKTLKKIADCLGVSSKDLYE